MSSILEPALSEALKPEDDYDAYWAAVGEVQKREPPAVWEALLPLATSTRAELRALVPDVLRFLGGRPQPLLQQTVVLLREMLAKETSEMVLRSIATAFVDLTHPGVVDLLSPMTRHPSAEVRLSAVYGLFQAAPLIAPLLIELTNDPDGEVRNWAIFSLGAAVEEGAAVDQAKEAFASRLEDPHEEARAEAVLALARCHDSRAIEPALAGLTNHSPWLHYKEAVEALIEGGLQPERLREALARLT